MVSRNVKPAQSMKAGRNPESSLRTILARFMAIMISTVGFIWLILSIGDWLFDWKSLAHTGILGAALILTLCALASALYVLVYLYLELQGYASNREYSILLDEREDNQLTDTLMAELELAYHEKRWEEVIKIGTVLSRPLWVTGKYRLRVRLGKLVEAAAGESENRGLQADTLINDLGWTKFVLGEVDEAKENIRHGIKLAQAAGKYYLVYKGYRHLSGIAREKGNLDEATTQHENALRCVEEELSDDKEKQEAFAGLHLNKAEIEIKKHNWDTALRELEAGQTLFRALGDKERDAKFYQFKGEVLIQMGNRKDAKDIYRQGITASERVARKDGILQNNLGIAKIAELEHDIKEAKRVYNECAKLAYELGRETLAKELEVKAATL